MDQPTDLPPSWPRCPKCDAPRTTRCPICETTGTEFPEADAEYIWGLGLDEVPEAGTCGCGSGCAGAASSRGQDASETCDEPLEASDEPADDEGKPERLVLTCPTCDEPFVPSYPRKCVWCGYEFDDGFEVDVVPEPVEQSNVRVIAVLIGMGVIMAVVAAYFILII